MSHSIFDKRDPDLVMGGTSATQRPSGVSTSSAPFPSLGANTTPSQPQPLCCIFKTPLGPSSGSQTTRTSLGFDWNIDRPSAHLATGSSTASDVSVAAGSPGFDWKTGRVSVSGSLWPPKAASGISSTTTTTSNSNTSFPRSHPQNEAQVPTQSPEEPLHDGIACGFCGKGSIRGVRYKCVQCPNYDRCSACMTSPSAWAAHDAAHQFFPIKTKDDLAHLALVVAKLPRPSLFAPRLNRVHPGITCDGCSQQIKGVRHKCLVCADYDFCGICITDLSKRNAHHAAAHPFFTIVTQEDETLYARTRTQAQTSANSGVRHDSVSCDSCRTNPLIGVRHRCLDCRDYDLCTQCISNPEIRARHDLTHAFFPISTPGGSALYNAALEFRGMTSGLRGSQQPAQLTAKISELVSGAGSGIPGLGA